MRTSMVDIQTPDGTADAYVARPDDDGHQSGVLLIMNAVGLRPWLEQMANRVAAQGYVVVAPNVFYRAGRTPLFPVPNLADPGERASFMAVIRPLMDQMTPDNVARDGEGYLSYLSEIAAGPAGITGYCMGGRVAWLIAAAHPDRVAALGCFHTGNLVTDGSDSPHLLAEKLRAEVYLGHADRDPSMTSENVKTLKDALDDSGTVYRSELYSGALHGYTMADSAAYDEDACDRHFRELFALLDRALRDPVLAE